MKCKCKIADKTYHLRYDKFKQCCIKFYSCKSCGQIVGDIVELREGEKRKKLVGER